MEPAAHYLTRVSKRTHVQYHEMPFNGIVPTARRITHKYRAVSPSPPHAHLWSLQWRHNERDDVSNYRRLDCVLNRLFRLRSQKTSKLRVTGLCEGNLPVTGEFPTQRASNAENVSIWWRHHVAALLLRWQQAAAWLPISLSSTYSAWDREVVYILSNMIPEILAGLSRDGGCWCPVATFFLNEKSWNSFRDIDKALLECIPLTKGL